MTQLTNGDGKRLYHAFGTNTVQKNKYLKITNCNKWLALFDVIITISIYFTYMVTTKFNWGRSYTDETPVIGRVCIHTLQLVKAVIGEQIQQVCGVELGCHKSMTVTTDPHRHCKTKQEE